MCQVSELQEEDPAPRWKARRGPPAEKPATASEERAAFSGAQIGHFLWHTMFKCLITNVLSGGRWGDRTPGLRIANAALSQLS